MKNLLFIFALLLLVKCSSPKEFVKEENVQLSVPVVTLDSVFFMKKATVSFAHGLEGSQIEVFSYNENKFGPAQSNTKTFNQSGSCRFRAVKEPFIASEEVEVSYCKIDSDLSPTSIQSMENPNETYSGSGINSLIDKQKAPLDFKSGEWLGFDQDSVSITLQFDNKKQVSKLILSSLYDENSWILPPSRVRVSQNGKLIHDWLMCPLTENTSTKFHFQEIDLKNTETDNLQIVLYPSFLPEWHPGAGNNAWLFLDEILFE